MRPDSRDMARLWDMLDAARTVVAFVGTQRYEVLWAVIEEKLPLLIQKIEEMGVDSSPSLGEL